MLPNAQHPEVFLDALLPRTASLCLVPGNGFLPPKQTNQPEKVTQLPNFTETETGAGSTQGDYCMLSSAEDRLYRSLMELGTDPVCLAEMDD